jgi:hypothetical protein
VDGAPTEIVKKRVGSPGENGGHDPENRRLGGCVGRASRRRKKELDSAFAQVRDSYIDAGPRLLRLAIHGSRGPNGFHLRCLIGR